MGKNHNAFMLEAIELSVEGMTNNDGGPFGCVIVKNGVIIGRGKNMVTSTCDPTAHSEITAIREACRNLNSFQLEDCIIYTSCEPCPMCLGAIYWARPDKVFFGATRNDAAQAGFDDEFIYQETARNPEQRKIPFRQICNEEANAVFESWKSKADKIES